MSVLGRRLEAVQAELALALGEANAPPPPPFPPAGLQLQVGVIGLEKLDASQRAMLGVRRTRIDVSSFAPGTPMECLKARMDQARGMLGEGLVPLILYNPEGNGSRFHGLSRERIQEEVGYVAARMELIGLTDLEFGNEVYEAGPVLQPEEYAQAYAWAHEVTAGVTLVCNTWINTHDLATNVWSNVAEGGGWTGLICHKLRSIPGAPKVPDAWSWHSYGPLAGEGYGEGGPPPVGRPGFATIKRLIGDMRKYGYYAPVRVTECGAPTKAGSDGVPAVSEQGQAEYVRAVIDRAVEWGLSSVLVYQVHDDGFGGYGLFHDDGTPKLSAGAMGLAVAAHGLAMA